MKDLKNEHQSIIVGGWLEDGWLEGWVVVEFMGWVHILTHL